MAALVALASRASGEVDFTPKESFYLAETTRVPNVAFRNGGDLITYSPPGGWTLSGGGNKLTLIPPDKVQADATMETEPVKVMLPATAENLKAYGDLAVNRIVREARKVSVTEAVICPMKFSTRTMVEVTLTYVLYGQQFTTNIVFLPFDKEQITFQVTARSTDFAPLAKAFRASLYSLQGL
jgi:hypothetical protein